ncbi:MAG: cellulase family glycosylhydrolase [Planctomycetia bacterium]|nr:cellulase family glycosylhydrolase [Planctomycetia bacterium]
MRFTLVALFVCVCCCPVFGSAAELQKIRVSDDKRGFVLAPSAKPFVPWGFNYDHDEEGRLIEDYWDKEWPKVEEDFREMKALGANVVRIHLQTGKFLKSKSEPNQEALDRLGKLLELAESVGVYLDLTGLGCYHKQDVPEWYDVLGEEERWAAQAVFWEAVAGRCAKSPAVFCYDLMNEPVVPGGKRNAADWLGPAFAGKHFVQVITLDQADRPRPDIARKWISQLAAAIRKVDKDHLVTVGMVDWSLDRPGLTSGFVPDKVSGDLDFICVHIYPKSGKLDEALATLKGFSVGIGKPVVIEEMFPLSCTADELDDFLSRGKEHVAGGIGFYWGKTPEEYRKGGTIGDAITLAWLELFQKRAKSVPPLPDAK